MYKSKDEIKIEIFEFSEHKWRSAIGDDVKDWINGKLLVWLVEGHPCLDELRRSTTSE